MQACQTTLNCWQIYWFSSLFLYFLLFLLSDSWSFPHRWSLLGNVWPSSLPKMQRFSTPQRNFGSPSYAWPEDCASYPVYLGFSRSVSVPNPRLSCFPVFPHSLALLSLVTPLIDLFWLIHFSSSSHSDPDFHSIHSSIGVLWKPYRLCSTAWKHTYLLIQTNPNLTVFWYTLLCQNHTYPLFWWNWQKNANLWTSRWEVIPNGTMASMSALLAMILKSYRN